MKYNSAIASNPRATPDSVVISSKDVPFDG